MEHEAVAEYQAKVELDNQAPKGGMREQRAPLVCWRCGRPGHKADACKEKRQYLPRKIRKLQTHAHSDLPEDGKAHEHSHTCELCGATFKHTHARKTEEESRKYKHHCRPCRKSVGDLAKKLPRKAARTPASVSPSLSPTSTPGGSICSPPPSDPPTPNFGEVVTPESPVRSAQPDDIRPRLKAFLGIQATGIKRDVTTMVSLQRRGVTWLKEQGVEDERDQEALMTEALPDVLQLTPAEQELRRRARSLHYLASNFFARQLGRGELHTSSTTARLAIRLAAPVVGGIIGAWLGGKLDAKKCVQVGRHCVAGTVSLAAGTTGWSRVMSATAPAARAVSGRHLSPIISAAARWMGFWTGVSVGSGVATIINRLTVVDLRKD